MLMLLLIDQKVINYFGEMEVQVNVSNRIHADYLEGDVPGYIWKVIL